ncbi:chitinase [Amycolatopsis pithecellobii]|nr:chitinase [Amycolatopsis pithecellobii]
MSKPATSAPGRFAPYVDTSLFPPFDLISAANSSGVKNFTLAFVLSGGGCTPKWGGVSELNNDGVPGQIGQLRQLGGDVRVSFGGANGIELAQACTDVPALASAYDKAISTYGLSQVDFDIEGGALGDVAASTRRAQAIAQLQKQKNLDVSFTLPVLPSGLTQDGVNLLQNAKANGVRVDSVNVMAMDYGDGAAPNPAGKMGQFAIDAATATQAQIKQVLGLSDADAWQHVAVTPMIGVNDVATEVFTVADATKLTQFAKEKNLAWLAMWSATRDKPCPGGPAGNAQATCSSIDQQPLDFTKAFGAF